MNRTVVPVLRASVAGSNAALVVPLPVIFTSTTTAAVVGAAGAAAAFAVAGTAAAACDAAGLLPPPPAAAPRAGRGVGAANRLADGLRYRGLIIGCEPGDVNPRAPQTAVL